MNIKRCIVKSFKNLFLPEVFKTVLLTSIPLFIFYALFLWLFWDKIVNFAAFITSWVPFSILKINGAFFVLFFGWFISVSVTFAFLSAIFGNLVIKKVQNYYLFVIVTILILSVIYALIFISNWDFIFTQIQKFLTLLPFETVSKFVGAGVGIYIFYNLYILTLFFLVFFFAKPFLKAIAELEGYKGLEIKEDIVKVIKDISIFMILFVVLFPLFFIPVVNVATQLFLWTKLYKDSFSYFVKKEATLVAVIAASFNFIPILNFFAPFFGIIVFYHCANLKD
jgi:hypothetical protein